MIFFVFFYLKTSTKLFLSADRLFMFLKNVKVQILNWHVITTCVFNCKVILMSETAEIFPLSFCTDFN